MPEESPRVLLADPQRTSCRALRRHLKDAGYNVQTAASGGEVILACDVDPPDVLIMDVRLPDMDGFEVCEYVRRETRDADVTVILMAEATDDMTRTSLGRMVDYAGGDYFLVKPCDGKLLVKLLDDLAGEVEETIGSKPNGFPTRVVWPTTRSQSLASSPPQA